VYGVIEDSRVSSAVDDAKMQWPRAEDAWEAVVWVLAPVGPGSDGAPTRVFMFGAATCKRVLATRFRLRLALEVKRTVDARTGAAGNP